MRASSPIRLVVSRSRCFPTCSSSNDGCSFRVAWSINPHMRVGAVDVRRAEAQHGRFLRTLRDLGAMVHEVPFVHGAFDSVFAKDNAVLVERSHGTVDALLAHPKYAVRRREQCARAAAFETLGIRVAGQSAAPLEGGDVVVHPAGSGAFLGYGFRSSSAAAPELEAFLDAEVTRVELRDPHLYHLDMVLSMLDDGTTLVCEDALTPAGRRAVTNHPKVRSVISVTRADAMRFGLNLVQVGRTILTAATAPATRRALRQRGFDVRRVTLDQFHLAGGSAACLVSRIHRRAAVELSFDMDLEAPPSAA